MEYLKTVVLLKTGMRWLDGTNHGNATDAALPDPRFRHHPHRLAMQANNMMTLSPDFPETSLNKFLDALRSIGVSPYQDREAFSHAVSVLIHDRIVPTDLLGVCVAIRQQTLKQSTGDATPKSTANEHTTHCFTDRRAGDEYSKEEPFLAELFVALIAQLTGAPILLRAKRKSDNFPSIVIHRREGEPVDAQPNEHGSTDRDATTGNAGDGKYVSNPPFYAPAYRGFIDGI